MREFEAAARVFEENQLPQCQLLPTTTLECNGMPIMIILSGTYIVLHNYILLGIVCTYYLFGWVAIQYHWILDESVRQ